MMTLGVFFGAERIAFPVSSVAYGSFIEITVDAQNADELEKFLKENYTDKGLTFDRDEDGSVTRFTLLSHIYPIHTCIYPQNDQENLQLINR